jgi:lysophospholipase L1-like esterase
MSIGRGDTLSRVRRALFWYVPLITALVAAVAFGSGFYSFLKGDTGEPVDLVPRAPAASATSAQSEIIPIIIGDSLARGTGDMKGLGIGGRLDAELKRRNIRAKKTVNIAVNGSRTGDVTRQLESANVRRLLGESNVIILSIGGNDLWGGTDWRNAPPPNPASVMDEVLGRVETIVKTVRQANPKARIYYVGLYNPFASTPAGRQLTPLVATWNAKLAERLANDINLTVVQTADLFEHHDRLAVDRFHPGDQGYELIARRIADSI